MSHEIRRGAPPRPTDPVRDITIRDCDEDWLFITEGIVRGERLTARINEGTVVLIDRKDVVALRDFLALWLEQAPPPPARRWEV